MTNSSMEASLEWLHTGGTSRFKTLFDAALKGTVGDVEQMIRDGADLNVRKYGMTPLMIAAAENPSLDIIEALIEAGADVIAKDDHGKTALDLARENGAPESVISAIKMAQPEMRVRALFDAVVKGMVADVEKLLKSGVDVNSREFGLTPLMLAARFSTVEMVKTLLDAGADARAVTKSLSLNAADFAKDSDPDIMKLLKPAGATQTTVRPVAETHIFDPNYQSKFVDIFSAASHGTVDDIKALIEDGADVNERTAAGITPLMLAAQSNKSTEVIKALLAAGADVNARSYDGVSVLIFSNANENLEVVDVLISAGGLY